MRRIQRLAMLASIVAGLYRWWQSGLGRTARRGWNGGGGGGAGRRAPLGGPRSPSALQAEASPEREPELVGAGAPSPARSSAGPAEPTPGGAGAGGSWTEPLADGSCPVGHPVKANDSSGIFHVPGGRFYDRTVAVRCYASPDAAIADGYRPAKA